MAKYRRVWERQHGPIPPGYHIHHVDGDRKNNDVSNLACVSPDEHYDIHFRQGDLSACYILNANRKRWDPEKTSQLSKAVQRRRLDEGTHNFLDPEQHRATGDNNRRLQNAKVAKGEHHWQTEEHSKRTSERLKGTKRGPETGKKISAKLMGNKNACGPKPRIECPHCGLVGGSSQMKRWHFDNCKDKI
jgi:hypothetical protein